MVVCDANLAGPCIPPSKDNWPLIVDSDATETLQIATQGLQSIAGGSSQIVQPNGVMDHIKFPSGNPDYRRPPNPFAELTGCEEFLGVPIRKGLDRHYTENIPGSGIPSQGISCVCRAVARSPGRDVAHGVDEKHSL
jgi:hypothetical protein